MLENVTVAVGDVGVDEVCVTVAVQTLAWLAETVGGLQDTMVVVPG